VTERQIRKYPSSTYLRRDTDFDAEMYERSDRDNVAWDIKTTGFGWSEEITVSGFWFPAGHASLVVNAGPHTVDGKAFEERLSETCDSPVSITVAEDETTVLSEMRRVVFERFDHE